MMAVTRRKRKKRGEEERVEEGRKYRRIRAVKSKE